MATSTRLWVSSTARCSQSSTVDACKVDTCDVRRVRRVLTTIPLKSVRGMGGAAHHRPLAAMSIICITVLGCGLEYSTYTS